MCKTINLSQNFPLAVAQKLTEVFWLSLQYLFMFLDFLLDGITEPLAIHIDTFGTSKKSSKELLDIVNKNFDLRPGMIIKYV